MPKTIIFCADGTWNGPGEPDDTDKTAGPTNVFKLYMNLAGVDTPGSYLLAKEQEREARDDAGKLLQIAKYLHGVGDSDNFLVKILGGTVGAGLITRIVRGYTFISRNFELGDRIIVTGFSRGAYTARAVAGLIAGKGLLNAQRLNLDDKDMAYRLGAAIWFDYRHDIAVKKGNWLDRLKGLALDLPGFFTQPIDPANLVPADIRAVAVWDTVGALGIPVFTNEGRLDIFQFADTILSNKVARGLHAVAIDELRTDFAPTLWQADQRIKQVLFCGAHGDVGGGNPLAAGESGLSDCALDWMQTELAADGVLFAPVPAFKPDPAALAASHAPWASLPWTQLPRGPRVFSKGLAVARFVKERLAGAQYHPTNLADYIAGGAILPTIVIV